MSSLIPLSLSLLAGLSNGQAAPPQGAARWLDPAATVPASVLLHGTPGRSAHAILVFAGEVARLDLEPASLTAPDFTLWVEDENGVLRVGTPGPSRTYRGRTDSFGGAEVAASWFEEGLVARLRTSSGEDIWVEPVGESSGPASPDAYVMQRGGTTPMSTELCAVASRASLAARRPSASSRQRSSVALRVAEIACETDFPFFRDSGSAAAVNDRIQGLLNVVNLQFERDVDLTHELTAIVVRTTRKGGPYTTRNPHMLLQQMADEWDTNLFTIRRDLVHLFIGRGLTFGQGIASLDAVCTSRGHSVSEPDACSTFACATGLLAHELGHNWGARHCTCPGGTMGGGGNRFGDESQADIRAFAATRTCLSMPCPRPAVVNRIAGRNLQSYTATAVAVGQPTTLRVDTQGFRYATVIGNGFSDQHALASGFVVLVNLWEPPVFVLGPLEGPVADASLMIAVRPAMCGRTIYTQALLHDAPGVFALSNAQDLIVGQ